MRLLLLWLLPIAVLSASAFAQEPGETVLRGSAAFGDWHNDRPGIRRLILPEDLPPPFATDSASNGADRVRRPDDAVPILPEGFSAQMIASGIRSPRVLRVAPNGDIFVADSHANQILVYRLAKDQAKPAEQTIFAQGLNRPYGIAFHPPGDDPEWIYVANSDSVVRFAYKNGNMEASAQSETIVHNIPTGGHWTRDIAFSPDGKTLFLSIGSASNVANSLTANPPGGMDAWSKQTALGAAWGAESGRASVRAFDPDGKNERIVATGLRNCSGMTVQPATGELWCVVNERDGLGDNLPFDYATQVQDGAFYGWPWYYIGNHEDPRHADARTDLAMKVSMPSVLMQAHSAPLGISFYEGTQFPAAYRGDAFVTLHGSWNRDMRTGYKVVRLIFNDGVATGEYEDFMTGFILSDDEVWGRPVGVTVANDGSLIVSEDGNGTIWRVTYEGG